MITLEFENNKPYIKAVIGSKSEVQEFTLEQAEQMGKILLEWVARENKKTMLIIAGQKFMEDK